MNETFRLGTVRGIAVGVNWTVLVIFALITWSLGTETLPDAAPGYGSSAYWVAAVAGAVGLLASILAHELSHSVVARRLGVEVTAITLWMFGGVSKLGTSARDARSELRIAIAGPAMSAIIAVGCLITAALDILVSGPELLTSTLAWLGVVNIMLAVFNMLPGVPLDGGHVLAAVLWHRSGDEHKSKMRAATAGRVVGQLLIGAGIVQYALGGGFGGLWLILIGWFLTSAARTEQASESLAATLEDVHVQDVMSRDVRTASANSTVDDFVRHYAATSPVSSFPVVNDDETLVGLITLRHIRALPQESWTTTTLGAIAVPIDLIAIAGPNDLLVDALRRTGTSYGRILVLDDGRLTGIVTPTDVTNALERLELTRIRTHGTPTA